MTGRVSSAAAIAAELETSVQPERHGKLPQIGTRFPDFALPDGTGHLWSLSALLRDGPVVVCFDRGGWCPDCRAELARWRELKTSLEQRGAHLVSIASETGGRAESRRDAAGASARLLCDVDHGLALAIGLAMPCAEERRQRYLEEGVDLATIQGGGGRLLSVPAVFVIDRLGVVRLAALEDAGGQRAASCDVLACLSAANAGW